MQMFDTHLVFFSTTHAEKLTTYTKKYNTEQIKLYITYELFFIKFQFTFRHKTQGITEIINLKEKRKKKKKKPRTIYFF